MEHPSPTSTQTSRITTWDPTDLTTCGISKNVVLTHKKGSSSTVLLSEVDIDDANLSITTGRVKTELQILCSTVGRQATIRTNGSEGEEGRRGPRAHQRGGAQATTTTSTTSARKRHG